MKPARCVQCGRRLGCRAVLLFFRPDDTAAFLCGRRTCETEYNGGPGDDLADCDCGAHRKAAA